MAKSVIREKSFLFALKIIELNPALKNIDELIRILTSIVKTTAENPAIQNSKLKT
jgi:hypothetical protein